MNRKAYISNDLSRPKLGLCEMKTKQFSRRFWFNLHSESLICSTGEFEWSIPRPNTDYIFTIYTQSEPSMIAVCALMQFAYRRRGRGYCWTQHCKRHALFRDCAACQRKEITSENSWVHFFSIMYLWVRGKTVILSWKGD